MSDPNKIVVKPTFSTQTINANASIRAMTGGAGGAVTSVNGQTGVVVLTAQDVGALPDDTEIPAASSAAPSMDGTASAGSATTYARADHVHPTDTSRAAASDLAAKITAPSSPATGAFLVYNGSAWVAQTVPSASGVNF